MAAKTITIRGKKYPEPSVDRMKRKQARKFQEISKRIELAPENMAMDDLWDMVEVLIPKLPEEVLDDLDFGECKKILEDADIMQFTDSGAPEPTEELGESSASPAS